MSKHDLPILTSDHLEPESPGMQAALSRLSGVTRRTALTGGGAGLAAALLAACGGSATQTTTTVRGSTAPMIFGNSKAYKFAFVCHAVDNGFFTPTRYGAADACELLGCSFNWSGSDSSSITEEIAAINTAISARVDGIATTLIDPKAFDAPISAALAAGIPVVSYNTDAPDSPRLAYIGQNLEAGGRLMGQQIRRLLPRGGEIVLFASTPGLPNLQPRLAGTLAALKGTGIKATVVASGVASSEQSAVIDSTISSSPKFKGFFGADQGSTQTLGAAIQQGKLSAKGIVGGGFDPNQQIEQLISTGDLAFAIDQQPYLQGFLAIVELYLYKVSEGLIGPADVDTGLKLVNRHNIAAYVKTVSRFEGDSTAAGVQAA